MQETPNPTAAVLVIGNEILSGRTADSNINMIAKKLSAIGVRLIEARVVADVEARIVEAVNELRARVTYLFTTGGIGPTHDDITAESVAKAFDVPLIDHPEARARLTAYYTEAKLNPARLRMARVPAGATLVDNPVSVAPGFCIENVYVLAGVPKVAEAMMDFVTIRLRHGPAIHSVTVSGNIGESIIAEELGAIAARYPALDIGSYPWFRAGKFGTALVVRGTDGSMVEEAGAALFALLEKHDAAPVRETTPSAA